jgi:hypothetical protein
VTKRSLIHSILSFISLFLLYFFIVSPQVVQILSQKPNAPLSLIKEFITRRLQHEQQLIAEDTRQIRSYQEETKKMRQEIYELRTR